MHLTPLGETVVTLTSEGLLHYSALKLARGIQRTVVGCVELQYMSTWRSQIPRGRAYRQTVQ